MRTIVIIIVIAAIVLLLGGRWFVNAPPAVARRALTRVIALLVIGVIILLAVTGRLHWLFAIIGGLAALLMTFWRARTRPGPETGEGPPPKQEPKAARMSKDAAYEILGLNPGASREEIIEAHRRLMQKVHPDRGGSSQLATQVNEAKSVLLDED